MEYLDDIMKLIEKEFKAVKDAGKFRSREDIHTMYELIDMAKDIYCIYDYEEDEDGVSYGDGPRYGSMRYDGNVSYARGRRGNVRRDSMGRYSRRGYAMDGGKDEYIARLRELMDSAPDDMSRQKVERMVREMESM